MRARGMTREGGRGPLVGLLATVLFVACGGEGPGTAHVTTPSTGFFVVTPPEGMDFTRARAISADGTAIVGVAGLGLPAWDAFHWAATGPNAGQITWLHPPAVDRQQPIGVFHVIVSPDGEHVAGDVFGTNSNSFFSWDAGRGQVAEWAHLDEALAHVRLGFDQRGATLFASGRQTSMRMDANGLQTLTPPAGVAGVQATGISEDGASLAGNLLLDARTESENDDVTTLFRWSVASGVEALPLPDGMATCQSDGWMSRAADVLFASCKSDLSASAMGLFRWNAEGGWAVLEAPEPNTTIQVEAADDAGTTLIGAALPLKPPSPDQTEGPTQVRRWTLSAGWQDLPLPTGAGGCTAVGREVERIGPNGAVVGACSTAGGGEQEAIWDGAGRWIVLSAFTGDPTVKVTSLSDDVHLVAGASSPDHDDVTNRGRAVVWVFDPSAFATGETVQPQLAEDFLQAVVAGVDLRGLVLRTATVSRDGKTLWGAATDEMGQSRAWIARLP